MSNESVIKQLLRDKRTHKFVVEGVKSYAYIVANTPVKNMEGGFINAEAWQLCAKQWWHALEAQALNNQDVMEVFEHNLNFSKAGALIQAFAIYAITESAGEVIVDKVGTEPDATAAKVVCHVLLGHGYKLSEGVEELL